MIQKSYSEQSRIASNFAVILFASVYFLTRKLIPCLGVNGGTYFKHSEAFSFQIATADQEETDKYWNAIVGNGGEESMCGWCKERWGLSWQITPRTLTEAMAKGGCH